MKTDQINSVSSEPHPITSVSVDHLPAIMKIIDDSQEALKRITGLNIKLQIIIVEQKADYKEMLWYSLQMAISSIVGMPWGSICTGGRSGYLPLYKKLYCYYGRKFIGGRTLKLMGQDVGMNNHTSAMVAGNDFERILKDPSAKDYSMAVKLVEKLNKRMEIKS